jgi:glyoxylate/hydroxypyruvate reductase A
LPANSYLVNAARGQHLITADLLDALSSGQLLGAAIDVFQEEPLSTSHPFWGNTKIMMTPHVASKTNYKTAAKCIAKNINNWERGGNLEGVVNSPRGY